MTAAKHDFNDAQCLEFSSEKIQVFLTPAVEKSIPVGTGRIIAMTDPVAIGLKNVFCQGVSDQVYFSQGFIALRSFFLFGFTVQMKSSSGSSVSLAGFPFILPNPPSVFFSEGLGFIIRIE